MGLLLKHPALQNIFWLVLERGFQILGGIFISGLIARHFGVELFGRWQYAQSMVAIAMAFTWICGAEVIVPKLSSKNLKTEGAILGTVFALRLAASTIVAIVFYMLIPLLFENRDVQVILLGLGLTLIFREPSMVAFAWFQSRTHTKPALLINIAALTIKILLVVYFANSEASIIWFALAWTFESIFIGFLLIYHLIRHYKPSVSYDRKLLGEFIQSGFFIWIGLIAMYGFFRIDRIVLERYLSPELFGYYAASAQLNENWIAIGAMLAQSVSPIFIYSISSKSALKKNIYKLMLLTAVISLVGAAILSVLSPFIITIVFGMAYEGSIVFFNTIVWLSFFVNAEAMLNTLILKRNGFKFFAFKWIIGLVIAVSLCTVLVPVYGAMGAIFAIYVSMFCVLLLTINYIRHIQII